ncbi:MAG: lysophospholipid acyltransferase family protein [Deltaproteobacteria bacterium]|nr:lysophospholipid acyltransferase family protein [Deltaproteobacteria bacterium]
MSLLGRIKDVVDGLLDPAVRARIDALPRKNLNEFGVDPFGFDPEMVKLVAPFLMLLKERYFRVETHGAEHIPGEGRFLLIGNHSGQLPFDAAMVGTTVLTEAPKPRLVRSMVERWSAELPFVSQLFARTGQIVGDPATCKRLLAAEEAVLVFPEGAKGISKLFAQRYQLGDFGQGFMRLALATRSPIVPFAVIGAEEQAPAIADIRPLARLLGLPAAPVIFPQFFPFPLPTHYRIWFGEPLYFKGSADDDDDDVAAQVKKVKNTVQRMVDVGLKKRTSVFF